MTATGNTSTAGGTYEVCDGGVFNVNAGATVVYARAGSTVNINAGGAIVYAETGAVLTVNGGRLTFLGDPDDIASLNGVPARLATCAVVIDGGC